MRITHDLLQPPPAQGGAFDNIIRSVAAVLLEYAGRSTTERPQLTHRDIAMMVGTDWRMVHFSLKSLQDKGAIRIEHNRLIINEEKLQKTASG
jgi:CRP-like cAMP-binding protein